MFGYLSIPMIVCIAGLILYLLVDHPKVSALAKDMFWVGLLVTLLIGVHRP